MKGVAGALYVDDGGAGTGTPVVFVHSLAGDTEQWSRQLEHVRARRRAVALDLRGHGRSTLTSDARELTMEDFARDLDAVVEGLGLPRVVLVGHSLGGAVCAAWAGAHPERVAGLFLLDPASDGRSVPKEQAQGMMDALATDHWKDAAGEYWQSLLTASTPEVRERVMGQLGRTAQGAFRGGMGALLTFDPESALKRYPGPVLSVITPLNESPGAYHVLVPRVWSEKVTGTGHWVQLDAPEQVNRLLGAFLAALP
ncbi:alpha/beta fold hydrolase [Corallococcus praedator]|uniref:Alpha/beta fold hydrolase n=1 Tax=Corallococcus praedator TaxID=2316724 RepID=A0ABX9QP75_9BACT|nr:MULTISPECIES: alpha/beta fold hydrolase [Corallococcus]RKH13209.1 alpha/beta fold hydrolase [Corallococcus sp. CA047B]RKH28035.1 alpha/beta fold hydrolase [Corallococcus sp. CA031C]RKI13011.1 alpha/beta fold hydrolase [Corallococcus praedator]